MLERADEEGYAHLISWCADGTSFQIHTRCHDDLVPLLKQKFQQTRYKSFVRQLQVYGFVRQTKGAQTGVCRHPFFVRHHREFFDNKSPEDFKTAATTMAAAIPRTTSNTTTTTTVAAPSTTMTRIVANKPQPRPALPSWFATDKPSE